MIFFLRCLWLMKGHCGTPLRGDFRGWYEIYYRKNFLLQLKFFYLIYDQQFNRIYTFIGKRTKYSYKLKKKIIISPIKINKCIINILYTYFILFHVYKIIIVLCKMKKKCSKQNLMTLITYFIIIYVLVQFIYIFNEYLFFVREIISLVL